MQPNWTGEGYGVVTLLTWGGRGDVTLLTSVEYEILLQYILEDRGDFDLKTYSQVIWEIEMES